MGFEPTRAEPIGLAVQRLNHSATSSIRMRQAKTGKAFGVCMWMNVSHQCGGYNWEGKGIPTPGVEPGPPGWKPDILAVRPRGIMFPSGIEPETFCVLGRCDNRYTTETCNDVD